MVEIDAEYTVKYAATRREWALSEEEYLYWDERLSEARERERS